MGVELFLPLWAFIVLMVGTPGPANLLVMSAGAQHGYRTCLPFMCGLIGGKLLLNIAMVLGLLSLIGLYPVLAQLFTYASAIYMTWLALQGWNVSPSVDSTAARPSFRQGLWVHPLNPKAWVMSTLAFSQFGAGYEESWQRYLVIPLSFAVAQLVLHSAWCVAGAVLRISLGGSLLLTRGLIVLTIATVGWALFFTA